MLRMTRSIPCNLFRVFALIVCCIVAGYRNAPAQVESYIPVAHPVYDFLYHLETRGVVSSFRAGALPITDVRVRRALEEAKANETRLSVTERHSLNRYKAEFAPDEPSELTAVFSGERPLMQVLETVFSRTPEARRTHTAWYNDGSNKFYLELSADMRTGIRSDEGQEIRRGLLGGELKLYGWLGEHIAYSGQTYRATLFGDAVYASAYPVILGGTLAYDASGGRPFFDDSRGYILYHNSTINALLGKEAFQLGYGRSGKLILSDNVRPFGSLWFKITGQWFTYSYLHGALSSQKQVEKFLVAQRLDFTPSSWLDVAISEMVIYTRRGFDLNYLSPLQYYRSISHNLGNEDEDNSLIVLDTRVRPTDGMQLYGSWLIDDFSFGYLFKNYGGNKFAFLAGCNIAIPDWSIWTEYVAIYPWVYSHRSLLNDYTHNRRILGHSAGPNSDLWYVEVQRWWSYRLRTSLIVSQRRHGENPPGVNIGGDVFNGVEENLMNRNFLGGILRTTQAVAISSLYELFNECYLQLNYQHERSEGKGNHQFDLWLLISL